LTQSQAASPRRSPRRRSATTPAKARTSALILCGPHRAGAPRRAESFTFASATKAHARRAVDVRSKAWWFSACASAPASPAVPTPPSRGSARAASWAPTLWHLNPQSGSAEASTSARRPPQGAPGRPRAPPAHEPAADEAASTLHRPDVADPSRPSTPSRGPPTTPLPTNSRRLEEFHAAGISQSQGRAIFRDEQWEGALQARSRRPAILRSNPGDSNPQQTWTSPVRSPAGVREQH